MPALEGIIYKSLDNFVVLRGFASIGFLAQISHKPDAYQRPADEDHKREIVRFIKEGKYTYFPDVILSCRAENYADFLLNTGVDPTVEPHNSQFVEGLRILQEYIPVAGHRARHANLNVRSNQLTRVDGNHRLEPFDEGDDWWGSLTDKQGDPIRKSDVETKIIPFSIIFTDKERADINEAGIFHNINFRHLPLRREASLKIISRLDTFDDLESFGDEYPLAMELIKRSENNEFNGIPFLTPKNDDIVDIYRTTCLQISKLLLDNKAAYEKELADVKYNGTETNILELEEKLKNRRAQRRVYLENVVVTDDDIRKNKTNINRIDDEIEQINNDLVSYQNINKRKQRLNNYINQINADRIAKAIHLLRQVYEERLRHQGSLELLVSLVHYRLFSTNMFNSFLKWIEHNRICEIESYIDEVPRRSIGSMIKLYDEIYSAKKRQIFISMQFGDDQSELIYEKILQAIHAYENENNDALKITHLRIDRSKEPLAFNITDKILEAIDSSSLIIADLSSANMNVYHEIGYAMGLAKERGETPPMILLYKQTTSHNKDNTDPDKFVGFNLRGTSQLRFSNYDTLTQKLKERIKRHFDE